MCTRGIKGLWKTVGCDKSLGDESCKMVAEKVKVERGIGVANVIMQILCGWKDIKTMVGEL